MKFALRRSTGLFARCMLRGPRGLIHSTRHRGHVPCISLVSQVFAPLAAIAEVSKQVMSSRHESSGVPLPNPRISTAEVAPAVPMVTSFAVSGAEHAGSVGDGGASGVCPGRATDPRGGPGTWNQAAGMATESAQARAEEETEEAGAGRSPEQLAQLSEPDVR